MKTFYSKELKSIILSIIFLSLGIVVLWFCKKVLEIDINGIIAVIIFIPVITYLLFSGVLKSFKYGSIEATLSDTISKIIETREGTNIESSIDEMQMVEKVGYEDLKRKIPNLDRTQSIVLFLTVGTNNYNINMLKVYVETLVSFSSFRFILFLNRNRKFVAYTTVSKFLKLLNINNLSNELLNFINTENYDLINKLGLYTDTINNKTKIIDSLKEMYDKDLDSLIVTDNSKNVIGYVEREYLMGKLLLQLVDQ